MTIDSTWLCAFKEELPHAFTKKRPFTPSAAFVDGQIRLMQGAISEPQTWDEFIFRQFGRHLQKIFDVCDVVILAFDNYEHVPAAKCMTQAKRRRNVPVIPFAAHSELPCMVPESERWAQCIANRTFKSRVIDLVLLRLPNLLLHGKSERRLIVDYHEPVEYQYDAQNNQILRRTVEGMPAMGEADLKFARHATHHGSLLVDSIDGDSIPIALMHHEAELRRGMPPPMVAVYRLELHVNTPVPGQKRSAAEAARKARTYEYVNIHALYAGLKDVIAQSTGRVRIPTHAGHEINMLVSLIVLTGTDFTRKLPLMTGKSVYSWLPDLWPTLVLAYDPETLSLKPTLAMDLIALMYRSKFNRHARSAQLQAVLDELHGSTMAPATKNNLPTVDRVACTIRNVNWVMAYWTCLPAPDPLQAQYGFCVMPNGTPGYEDAARLAD